MTQKPNHDYLIKLLLIGDSGVGKTSLLYRFSEDTYNPSFIATIGIDFKIKTVTIGNKVIKLQIWDTAGQERFRTITTAYYRGAMGIMLVYDVTKENTYSNITQWMTNVEMHANEDVQKMLLGNKCDLAEDRVISYEQGQQLATQYDIDFYETSARSNQNVTEAFMKMTALVKQYLDDHALAAGDQPKNGNVHLDGKKKKNKHKLKGCSII